MRRIALLFFAWALGLVSGCATDDPNRVSSIPWNRPERWEGQGWLGGFNQPTR
jgi:hypothetical protein